MTNNELKKLSRADLLEMLIDQSTELEALRKKLASAEAALQKRQIAIDQAGSIAEASLLLNGVFEAAERACQQYTDNIRQLSERQESVCLQMENESRRKADQYQADVERRCAELEAKGEPLPYEQVLADIEKRDYDDSHRAISPLVRAQDAVLVDSTGMDADAVVQYILSFIKE